MYDILVNICSTTVAYALGCLTTGYYLVRSRTGSDVRSTGSGSVGATNVGRLIGNHGFVLTFFGDLSKGVLALLLAKWSGCQNPWLALVVLSVVVGHVWPMQLKFNGGKGVATTMGGLLVQNPLLTLILMGVFGVFYSMCRDRGASGIAVFMCLPLFALLFERSIGVSVVYLALASLLIWTHRNTLVLLTRAKTN